ncbi:MAG: hypothetical protein II944_01410 [Ruminobacter sp.]|nr:hypothetical protein [Ruminobacter sp.]
MAPAINFTRSHCINFTVKSKRKALQGIRLNSLCLPAEVPPTGNHYILFGKSHGLRHPKSQKYPSGFTADIANTAIDLLSISFQKSYR